MKTEDNDTFALVVTAPIGDLHPVVEDREVASALCVDDVQGGISRVELCSVSGESADAAWLAAIAQLEEGVGRLRGQPTALFGFAPIPLLAALGRLVGDKAPCAVYDRHRRSDSWVWESEDAPELEWKINCPNAPASVPGVVVLLSISGEVRPEEIPRSIGSFPVYSLAVHEPTPGVIRSRADLGAFVSEWRRLLGRIRSRHGPGVIVHLLPASPLSVSIEVGRRLLPKADPTLRVYDSIEGGFRYGLSLGADGARREPLTERERRRILLVSASPRGPQRLGVDHEYSRLSEVLRQPEFARRFEHEFEMAVSYDRLEGALRAFRPHILHVSCHADAAGTLTLADSQNNPERIPLCQFTRLLSELAGQLELVVLNACYSKMIARELPPSISLAVGMNDTVGDDAAVDFACAFYRNLVDCEPHRAFELARNKLREHCLGDLPELFPCTLREGERGSLRRGAGRTRCVDTPRRCDADAGMRSEPTRE